MRTSKMAVWRIRFLRRCLPITLFLAVFLAMTPRLVRAQAGEVCAPSPPLKAALDALPSQTPADTDWGFHQKLLADIRALLQQYPGDVFVQRRYINAMYRQLDKDEVIAEYKARHEQNPEDAHISYLYGLTLQGRQSGESIKLFDSALEKDPQFLWPHLALAAIYWAPVFLDKGKSVAHVKAFLDACPASFDGYEALSSIDDKALLTQSASKLRAILQARSDLDAIGAYQTLWALEFKAHPPSEYDPLRKQVAQDVQRIRALNLQDKREWYETLEDGYKLANDQKQSDWAKDEHTTRFPHYWELASMSKWQEDHHYPGDDAPADVKHAYYAEAFAQTSQWIKERPNLTFLWWERLDAMIHMDAPPADIETAADQGFKVALKNGGPPGPSSDDYFSVARVLAKKHLEPERVVELVQKGLAQFDLEAKEPYYDLYATKDNLAEHSFYQNYQRLDAVGYQTDAYLQLEQSGKVQVELSQTDQRLQELKSLAGDKQDRKKSYSIQLAAYWGRMGRLAELQGHKLDAMAFYENALLTRLDAQQKPEVGAKDELADDAQRLWASLGGTAQGWQIWYGRRADALSELASLTWEDANDPLPVFELADLNGKTWNLESLKGKVTFLNFWASW